MLKYTSIFSIAYRLWKRKREDRARRLYRKAKPSRMNTSKHRQLKQELGL